MLTTITAWDQNDRKRIKKDISKDRENNRDEDSNEILEAGKKCTSGDLFSKPET